MGEDLGFAKKGRFSVVHGSIVTYFQPYHVDFSITNKNEINQNVY
jgi:hypothetical protein